MLDVGLMGAMAEASAAAGLVDWKEVRKDKGLDSKSGVQPFNALHYLFL